jgi:predicted DNA-binding protein YlxM (UPF0122 family)
MAATGDTAKMAKFYQNGLSLEAIGKQFGMTRQAVRERFIKAGIARRKNKYEQINKDRLETLYFKDKMPISEIADVFSVSPGIVRQALKFHKISRRKPLNSSGYKVDFLRSLGIGEKRVFEWRNNKRYIHLHDTANRICIKISIKSLGGGNFEITRLK